MSVALALLLTACWQRAPGPVARFEAEGPVDIVEERLPSPSTTFSVSVRAGSAHDPPGREGLAWLTAQAIVLGGTTARPAAELHRDLYALGAELRAEVGPEVVTFTLRCDRRDDAACGALLAELVTRPALDEAALARARELARARLDAAVLGPARALAGLALDRAVYQGHPYGHAAIGRLGALDSFTADELRGFHDGRYLRPAATLGLVGQPEAETVVDVQAALAALPPRLYRDVTPRALPQQEGRALLVVEAPVEETWVVLGHGTDLAPGHPDRLAVEAGLEILGDGPDSRLGRALRVGEGAPVLVDARLGGAGLRIQPAVRVSLRPEQATATLPAVAAALAELERLVREGPTPEELQRWQGVRAGGVSVAVATPAARVEAAAAGHLLQGPPLSARATAVAALTPARVAEALASHVRPADLHIAVVTADAAPFRDPPLAAGPAIEGPAPSPVSVDEAAPWLAAGPAGADYGVGIARLTVISSAELLR